jgi:hypothetical protein
MINLFEVLETNTVRGALQRIGTNLNDLLDLRIDSDHSIEGRKQYHLERNLVVTILKEADSSLLDQPFDTETRKITAEDAPKILCRPGLVTKKMYDSVSAKKSGLILPSFVEWEKKMKELRKDYGYAEPVCEQSVLTKNNSSFFSQVAGESSSHSLDAEGVNTRTASPETEVSEDEHIDKRNSGFNAN